MGDLLDKKCNDIGNFNVLAASYLYHDIITIDKSISQLAILIEKANVYVMISLIVREYEILHSLIWSVRRRLQREQRELKAPQERSDEEIEVVPVESVRLERKSTLFGI